MSLNDISNQLPRDFPLVEVEKLLNQELKTIKALSSYQIYQLGRGWENNRTTNPNILFNRIRRTLDEGSLDNRVVQVAGKSKLLPSEEERTKKLVDFFMIKLNVNSQCRSNLEKIITKIPIDGREEVLKFAYLLMNRKDVHVSYFENTIDLILKVPADNQITVLKLASLLITPEMDHSSCVRVLEKAQRIISNLSGKYKATQEELLEVVRLSRGLIKPMKNDSQEILELILEVPKEERRFFVDNFRSTFFHTNSESKRFSVIEKFRQINPVKRSLFSVRLNIAFDLIRDCYMGQQNRGENNINQYTDVYLNDVCQALLNVDESERESVIKLSKELCPEGTHPNTVVTVLQALSKIPTNGERDEFADVVVLLLNKLLVSRIEESSIVETLSALPSEERQQFVDLASSLSDKIPEDDRAKFIKILGALPSEERQQFVDLASSLFNEIPENERAIIITSLSKIPQNMRSEFVRLIPSLKQIFSEDKHSQILSFISLISNEKKLVEIFIKLANKNLLNEKMTPNTLYKFIKLVNDAEAPADQEYLLENIGEGDNFKEFAKLSHPAEVENFIFALKKSRGDAGVSIDKIGRGLSEYNLRVLDEKVQEIVKGMDKEEVDELFEAASLLINQSFSQSSRITVLNSLVNLERGSRMPLAQSISVLINKLSSADDSEIELIVYNTLEGRGVDERDEYIKLFSLLTNGATGGDAEYFNMSLERIKGQENLREFGELFKQFQPLIASMNIAERKELVETLSEMWWQDEIIHGKDAQQLTGAQRQQNLKEIVDLFREFKFSMSNMSAEEHLSLLREIHDIWFIRNGEYNFSLAKQELREKRIQVIRAFLKTFPSTTSNEKRLEIIKAIAKFNKENSLDDYLNLYSRGQLTKYADLFLKEGEHNMDRERVYRR